MAPEGRRGVTLADVFEGIYQANAWNGVESLSGPGSGPAATSHLARDIVDLVAELHIPSVLDVACGDGFWMPHLPGYIGVDVSETALRLARERHPRRAYILGDVRDIYLPSFGLVIVRDVIQHLPLADGAALLDAVSRTRPRYILASTYLDGDNVDIEAGGSYRPDLEREPFAKAKPVRLLFDGYTYHDPDAIRDPGKHLGLWRLRR